MKLNIVLISILVFVALSIGFLYLDRHEPILYRYEDTAASEHSSFIIQNPFRDRGPENAAESVFELLEKHQCHQALSLRDIDAERTDYLCDREERYALDEWSIMDRIDSGSHVHLIYRSTRMVGTGEGVPIDIDVEKLDGKWVATKYDTAY